MSKKHVAKNLVICVTLGAGIWVAQQWLPIFGGRSSYPIATDTGDPIASVFAGIQPVPGFQSVAAKPRGGPCPPEQAKGISRRLLSFLAIRSVSAQVDCGSGGDCGGAWFTSELRPCGQNCGGADSLWYYSDASSGGACSGWRPTGTSSCAGCGCSEEGCDSCAA